MRILDVIARDKSCVVESSTAKMNLNDIVERNVDFFKQPNQSSEPEQSKLPSTAKMHLNDNDERNIDFFKRPNQSYEAEQSKVPSTAKMHLNDTDERNVDFFKRPSQSSESERIQVPSTAKMSLNDFDERNVDFFKHPDQSYEPERSKVSSTAKVNLNDLVERSADLFKHPDQSSEPEQSKLLQFLLLFLFCFPVVLCYVFVQCDRFYEQKISIATAVYVRSKMKVYISLCLMVLFYCGIILVSLLYCFSMRLTWLEHAIATAGLSVLSHSGVLSRQMKIRLSACQYQIGQSF